MAILDLFDLANRKAIITGGSRGLGLQIAKALGDAGAEVLITSRKQDELDAAVAELRSLGIKASAIAADLGNPDKVVAFADAAINALGGQVDILVNNAGAAWGAPAQDTPIEAWMKLVNLNLTGIFLLSREVGKRCMIPAKYGRILNVASIAGLRGNPPEMQTIAYNTTKGGVVNFTRALAGEWGVYGINVNALAPGFFPSRMTAATLAARGDTLKERAPLKRYGDDEDLQGAALLFCSKAGKHITGQILAVDGGVSAIHGS
jgi:NAD(P)-dependent dehydrogenase (short-subunit alcohol dehydrogenase family)